MPATPQRLALITGLVALPMIAWALDGSELFTARCSQCHKDDSIFNNKSAEQIRKTLVSGTVKKHRFVLSSDEIDALTAYLTSSEKR
jgi:mono/diheme cytochrome c family protein